MWWRHAERPLGTRTYTLQRSRHGLTCQIPRPKPLELQERTPTAALALPVARNTRPLSLPSWHKCRRYLPRKTRATCSIVVAPSRQASSLPVQRLQSSMRSCLRTVGPVLRIKKWDSGFAGSVNSAKIRQTCVLACPERSHTLSEQTSGKLRCSYWFAQRMCGD